MTSASPAIDSLARLRARFATGGPAWLVGARAEAFRTFVEAGFPTRRLEAWKSTNLAALAALDFASITSSILSSVADASGPSRDAGVRVRRLSELDREEQDRIARRLGSLADPKRSALVALSTACLEDALVVELGRGARPAAPIRVRLETPPSDARPNASFTRLLVLADEQSEATLEIEHVTPRAAGSAPRIPGFTNHVAEAFVGAGAHVELVEIQAESEPQIHFSSLHAEVERSGRFTSHVVTLSDALVRSELEVRLLEPGAETRMNGLFLGQGEGHVDHFTTVEHAAPHCTSAQDYRGVVGDHAKGVFRGRVIVRPGAQKTDASQSNPNLLLSDTATIDARPQLEIYADDVRASHGSTIGQLDADALFFLRARGIGEGEARRLLTRAFARTIVDGLGDPELRQAMDERIDRALARIAIATPDGRGNGPRDRGRGARP